MIIGYDLMMKKNKMICGKCGTKQLMTKIFYGKRKEEYSWWCSNCEDKISQSAVCKGGSN